MVKEIIKNRHNQLAPYWALALFLFLITGLSTINFELGSFWNGYVLDMVGPAWNYILFRRLFIAKADKRTIPKFRYMRMNGLEIDNIKITKKTKNVNHNFLLFFHT